MNRNSNNASSSSRAPAAVRGTAKSEDYFDLHVKGCGYLSRIREVPVKGGRDAFLACTINAMHGQCDSPSYSYFDLRVTGQEAEVLVRDLWKDVDAHRKVFIAFRAGDIYADPFEGEEKDPKTRQPTGRKVLRASIKGRLLQITHAKVDDEVVYQADPSDGQPSGGGEDDGVGSAQSDDNHQAQGPNAAYAEGRPESPRHDERRRFDRSRDRTTMAA